VRELCSRFCDESPEAKQNLVLAFHSVKAAAKLPALQNGALPLGADAVLQDGFTVGFHGNLELGGERRGFRGFVG